MDLNGTQLLNESAGILNDTRDPSMSTFLNADETDFSCDSQYTLDSDLTEITLNSATSPSTNEFSFTFNASDSGEFIVKKETSVTSNSFQDRLTAVNTATFEQVTINESVCSLVEADFADRTEEKDYLTQSLEKSKRNTTNHAYFEGFSNVLNSTINNEIRIDDDPLTSDIDKQISFNYNQESNIALESLAGHKSSSIIEENRLEVVSNESAQPQFVRSGSLTSQTADPHEDTIQSFTFQRQGAKKWPPGFKFEKKTTSKSPVR